MVARLIQCKLFASARLGSTLMGYICTFGEAQDKQSGQ